MISAFKEVLVAESHTPAYMMHKYFARRPWNVFRELISYYSNPGATILDPFCGGGVTVVESLKLRRKAVGVDANPIATYVTDMEGRFVDLQRVRDTFDGVSSRTGQRISALYATKCPACDEEAIADWIEWSENTGEITQLKFDCSTCGTSNTKKASRADMGQANKVEKSFARAVKRKSLWYPQTPIPRGDKTDSLRNQGVYSFSELFTRRNLLALSLLLKEIEDVKDDDSRALLRFTFSSSLKWASRMSHLRGKVVEGWAMHAYWIYPKSLEINVWNTFERRMRAVLRGKEYTNGQIGAYARPARIFDDLVHGNSSYFVLNQSSSRLPLPDESVDAVITDPPYGGNVNYAELSDYWQVWLNRGKVIDKEQEVIINRTQGKNLDKYEILLCEVFKECCRVLKPERYLVSTFNSKNIRVVASFITAASRAGFRLHPEGIVYQQPIRSYTTTFHAMQVGAFVGDFIFTFIKDTEPQIEPIRGDHDLRDLKHSLEVLMSNATRNRTTETELREKAYRMLIPFISKHAGSNTQASREATDFLESRMREHDSYFRRLRVTITEGRRRKFSHKKQL
jgi:16S rRNA G966 N2-methylase RsmD